MLSFERMVKMRGLHKQERINILLKCLMTGLFILGLGIFSYPFVADAINNFYDQIMLEKLSKEHKQHFLQESQQLEEMKKSNLTLNQNKCERNVPGICLSGASTDAANQSSKESDTYKEKHLLALIYIPKINVGLPLFDTTTNELLEDGVTLLPGTSYPVGGKNSHAVITGHCGLPNKKIFTDLENLSQGDLIYIEIANKTLAYEVKEFQTVLPTEVNKLKIVEGQDLITLVTCTPYMVNTHRLLVTATRTEVQEKHANKAKKKVKYYHTLRLILLTVLLLSVVIILIKWLLKKIKLYKKLI